MDGHVLYGSIQLNTIPFGLRRDGKMMDSNFVALEIVGKLRQNHIVHVDELWEIIRTKYNHELSYYKV